MGRTHILYIGLISLLFDLHRCSTGAPYAFSFYMTAQTWLLLSSLDKIRLVSESTKPLHIINREEKPASFHSQ